jgi:Ca2+-binding RTX toxin-like protein
VFGTASGFPAAFDLSSLDGSNGFRLDGAVVDAQSGDSVSGAGDVNGDGFQDVMVGASGSSYVVFGKPSGFPPAFELSSLDGSNGFRLNSGRLVASGGDVNGDGFVDLMVNDYIVFGKASGFPAVFDLSSLDGSNGFRLDDPGGRGISVAGAGDVNGDGFDDIIYGSYGSAIPWSSYVIFGRAPDTARTRIGSAASQYMSGGPFNDTLEGLLGSDSLEGRGGADALIGGRQRDTASYLHAATGVKASLANPALNTGDAAGDTYTLVENLIGSRFADKLIGDGKANWTTGGLGPDVLTGRGDKDTFVYNALVESPPGVGRDQINHFTAGEDKIDLIAIDAKTGPGNQAFNFIGTAPFSSTKGELRVQQQGAGAIIQGDINGDSVADLEIRLSNFAASTLTALDFRP